jgi:DNA-binding response OmpR family regulator
MTPHTASGIDIFVVDDERLIAHTLGIILSQIGYCVRVFNDPITARLHLHHSPRLLISDYQMPGLTGLELATIAAEETPCTQVILFSANLLQTESAWQVLKRNSGGARLLAKPLSPPHLLAHIKEMIGPPLVEGVHPKNAIFARDTRYYVSAQALTATHR